MKALETLMLAAALFLGAPPAEANNSITLTAASAAPGTEVTVDVALSNSDAVGGIQIDLPFGKDADFTVVEYGAAVTARAAGHAVTVGKHDADGRVTVMIYSTKMTPVEPGEGSVASFRLKLGKTPGTWSATPVVKLTDVSGALLGCTAGEFTFTTVAPRAVFETSVDLGHLPIRSVHDGAISVSNTGTAPLVINGATCDNPDISFATAFPLTVPVGASDVVSLKFVPLKRGAREMRVSFDCNSPETRNYTTVKADPYAVNILTIGDASGVTDSEVTIPVSLSNMDAIEGFTLEIALPEQLEYVDGSFALSSRAAADSRFTAGMNGRTLKVNCYSPTNTPFSGNDGELASFRVRLTGRYDATVAFDKAVLAADIDGVIMNVTSSTESGQVSILYPSLYLPSQSLALGRTSALESASASLTLNNYGSAPLTVSRALIDDANFAVDTPMPLTIEPWQSADIAVTIGSHEAGEFKGTLQLYTNDPDNRLVNIAVDATRFIPNALSDTEISVSDKAAEVHVPLSLANTTAVSALQFDVAYDADIFTPADGAAFTARADGFEMEHRSVADGVERVFIYSVAGREIAPGEGEILALPFTVKGQPERKAYVFELSDIKLSSAAMTNLNSSLVNCFCTVAMVAKAESITLDRADLSMEEGRTVTLVATVLPEDAADKSVAWTSSDESVATVSPDGEVNAIAKGVADITVRTLDGTNLTATCRVAVTEPAGISDAAADTAPTWRVDGRDIIIGGTATPQRVTLATLSGTVIATATTRPGASLPLTVPAPGLYLLTLASHPLKLLLK